jgi:hypothetical protein
VKRLPILVTMFLVLFCLSIMLSANNMGSIINDVLIIPYVEDAPIIDGTCDWDFARIGMRVYGTNNTPKLPAGGAADLSAWYQVAWNEDGLYFYGEVYDDTLTVATEIPASSPHTWDSWEIFIDGDNSKGAAYDGVNDVQFRWIHDLTVETQASVDCEVAWAAITGGAAIEIAIPATGLVMGDTNITLTSNQMIGWEVQYNDAEVGGTRQQEVKWWNEDDRAWQAPSYFGTAKLSDDAGTVVLQIPKIADAPVVDGTLDAEWTSQVVPKVAIPVATSNNTPNFARGGYEDLSAWYKVAWNEDGLYFYGECIDDSVTNVSVEPASSPHTYDSWEIFIDGDNSKGASYDGVNDVQLRWINSIPNETQIGLAGEEVVWTQLSNGYALELAIPAAALVIGDTNITLTDDQEIGWEVQINDAEVEAVRESQVKWWCEDDRAWQAPSYFGTAVLSADGNDDKVAEEALALKLSAPAVINSSASISYTVGNRGTVNLSLYNIAGQEVACLVNGVEDAGTHTVSLDASGLANGVYLAVLATADGSASAKVMLIK